MEKYMIIIPIVFGLMLLVNIATEVLKNVFKKVPTNALALVLSLIITFGAMVIWLNVQHIVFVWWMILVAIAVAFMVAYAAMFGFDKFKQLVTQWQSVNSTKP